MIAVLHGTERVYIHAGVSVTETASVLGRLPRATLTITPSSPAWSEEVIRRRGGMAVTIYDNDVTWKGIADNPRWNGSSVILQVFPVSKWLELVSVGEGVFCGVTGGTIFRAAWKRAFRGRGAAYLKLGYVLEAPPIFRDDYEFSNQSMNDVLNDLMEITGHEWMIDTNLTIHWLPRQGRYHDRSPLVDTGRLFPEYQDGSLTDEHNKVLQENPYGPDYVAHSFAPRPLWPSIRVER